MDTLIFSLLGLGFLGAGGWKVLDALRFKSRAALCRARVAGHVAYRSAQTGSTKRTYRPEVEIQYPDGTYGRGVIGGLALSSKLDAIGTMLDVLVDPQNVSDVRRASTFGLFSQSLALLGVGACLSLSVLLRLAFG